MSDAASALNISGASHAPKRAELEQDDAALMARICEGEEVAFAQLVRRHSTRFYRVAYRFVGKQAEAEDMVQEAFLKLWRRPTMWRTEFPFTTWFYRVVVNQCLDSLKKKRPVLLGEDRYIADDRLSHEDLLIEQEKQQLMENAISALPDRQRTALNLCFYEDLSNEEAAKIMGISLKALQSLLMRAKTILKQSLKDYPGGHV